MQKKINFVALVEILVVLTIILDLNSMYYVLLRMSSSLRISFFCIFFLLLLIILKRKNIRCKKTTLCGLVLFVLVFVSVNMYLNLDGLKTLIIYYILIFFLFYFYFSTNGQEAIISMIDKFIKIVFILSIISLFFWICADCLKIINPTGQVYIDIGTYGGELRKINTYYYLHFDAQKINVGNSILMRNSGIFSEAPMFAMIILVAIMFQLFVKEITFSKMKTFIFILTIITTTSVTGILCSTIMLLLYFEFKDSNAKLLKQLTFIMLPIVAIVAYNILQEKSTTMSYSNRLLDYKNAFEVFKSNMLFGKGIHHEHLYEGTATGYGYSNSISKIITDGGIYLSLFYIVALFKTIKIGLRNNINLVIMAAMCFVFAIFIIYVHNILAIFLLSIAYSLRKEDIKSEI